MSPSRPSTARTGRRPGPTDTRDAILGAARAAFVAGGYGSTSLRSVAREAGVDPSLVTHFFGSKAGLFTAAVGWPFDPDAELQRVVAGGREHIGTNLTEVFLRHWEDERERSPILAMLHIATGDPAGAEVMRDYLASQMLEPLIETIGGDRAPLRAGLISAQLFGLGILRYVLAYEPVASAPLATIIATTAGAIQRLVDEPLEA